MEGEYYKNYWLDMVHQKQYKLKLAAASIYVHIYSVHEIW